ncbi:hypothetical protein [Salipiger bermudensis]|uniref:hypothetical protein n=1 Tax=Salipiger bermudensis TaxID=344736 RepID=UPI001CD72E32|nr:hypothetical protein [Salipiger bermudensis]MCA0963285.1 hypothetical protein [Salipiger bermudensis]
MTEPKKQSLVDEARADNAERDLLIETYKESTGLTWLWSLLFGPIYFWVHGFVGMGFIVLIVSIATFGIGILAAPFLAYYAWRKRAEKKASNMVAVSKLRR